jgi:hypothetical protein
VLGDGPVDSASAALAQLSDQKPPHGFRSMAVGTTGADVETRFQIADQMAQAVAKQPTALASIASCMAVEPATPACIEELLTSVGLRLFRRPLDADELTWVRGLYANGEAIQPGDGLRFALLGLVESPHFLYRLETHGAPSADGAIGLVLTPYELASRLSFLVWGIAPDAALLQSAASGSLDTDAGLADELKRLFADARARAQLSRFFEQWLEFEQLPTVNQSETYLAGISGQSLPDAMQHELSETLLTLTLDDGGKFEDLYTTDLSFVGTSDLAELYGITLPRSGGSIQLDPMRRAGLLTRAALMLTTGETTSPIHRGAFVKRQLLCDAPLPPDPSSFPPGTIQPPAFDPDATSRERWTAKTSPAACQACHGQFNALGFALENYDAIGRYRDEEPIIDPMSGTEVKQLPIEAEVDVTLDSTPVRVNGAVELGRAFAASDRARSCLAVQWLRFTAGRLEQDADACVLQDVASGLAEGAPLLQALERVVLAPEFRVRRVEAP